MKAAIIGATGLVGQQLLPLLLASDRYDEVHVIGRREVGLDHPKLVQHITELRRMGELELNTQIDHGFCTLGTTIKQASSAAAFKRVDRDYVCEFGKLMKRLGATAIGVNSSLGANSKSRNFYLQTKGEMEDCLREYNFSSLVFVRPSLLVPTGREEFRLGEVVGFKFFQLLGWLFLGPLRRYRPVEPGSVAKAIYKNVQSSDVGTIIIESESIETSK